jgi:hypothetical protein
MGAALALAAGLFVAAPSNVTQAQAGSRATFIVPANDGYGVGDCVASGSACAKVVADSWCEAQGFARSESFGLAEAADVTASVGLANASRPISITCAQ